ncbi:hypothetical protein GCM10022255_044820 [Dactylosporangium darangshiense]|uniref:Uncharacterized protein n=1 Tax=Dactylosporangium darangshiense TaxID=579108 RepID=A0ABP8DAX3_9ACTN
MASTHCRLDRLISCAHLPRVLRADGTAAVTASEGAPARLRLAVLPMSARRARSNFRFLAGRSELP